MSKKMETQERRDGQQTSDSISTTQQQQQQTTQLHVDRTHEIIVIQENDAYLQHHFLVPSHYQNYVQSVLIPHGLIIDRVEKLAQDIRMDFPNSTVHLLCVLKGGSAFFHDLVAKLRLFHTYNNCPYIPFTFDFIKVKSYHGIESTGTVQISGIDCSKLRDKHVILIEDIIDTGLTMSKVIPMLREYCPKSVKVATLLQKRTPKSCGLQGDYVGFSIPDSFVVGYSLDYNEVFRDMRHICVINEAGIAQYADHE